MNSTSFTTWKKNFLRQNPKVNSEYQKLVPEMALVKSMIAARIKQQLTQAQLADKIGTKQSVISRVESGRANPSFNFLKKVAAGLECQLEVKFF